MGAGAPRRGAPPLTIAAGEVDCELHYKLYYPIEDHHPELARRLKPSCSGYDHVAGAMLRIVEPLLERKKREPSGLENHVGSLVDALVARESDTTDDNRNGPYRALQLAASDSAAAAREIVRLLESKGRLGPAAKRLLRMAKRRLLAE